MRLSKYRAVKIKTEDGVFDSKKEYLRWCKLKQMEEDGIITKLVRQRPFVLIPVQKTPTVTERAVKYYADFCYFDENGYFTVEDTKGVRTPEYVIKRKLMLREYGIEIKEV